MANLESDKEIQGDKLESPTHATRERLTLVEVQRTVDKCIDLRYKADKPILQREWIDYCQSNYGDKSVPQYINYWMTAKAQYDEGWRGSLENLIEPAIDVLREGLTSNNPLIKAKTIDQIMKYSGNDIQKHHVLTQDISIGFGEE